VAGGVWAVSQGKVPGLSLTDAGTLQDVAALEARFDDLENSIRQQTQAPVQTPATAPAPQAATAPASDTDMRGNVSALDASVRKAEAALQTMASRLAALEQKAGSDDKFTALQAQVARQIAGIDGKIAPLERDVQALNKAQAERIADARAAALTLALSSLKRAVAEGRPFGSELAAVESLSSTKLPVSSLGAYKNGVATAAALERDFAEAAKKAIEATYRSNPSGSIMTEVFARARAAVQVRQPGAEDTSIETLTGKIAAALKADRIAEAVNIAKTVEGPAKAALQPWLDRAIAKVAADEALRKTDEDLLAALTKPLPKAP
jgi:hypothetical protein